jgi:hypothetical protein
MTNTTPLTQETRRQIVLLANHEYEHILDISMQLAMDNCQDLPVSEDDDENERTITAAGLQIALMVMGRMRLKGMLEVIS